jgi:phosphatidylserine/phosphatidylglycerophosphate/cardiolipin synthase-like enzyme
MSRLFQPILLCPRRVKLAHILLVALLLARSLAFAGEVQMETAFSPQQGATKLITRAIGQAHKTIRVAAYLLTSHPIANALIRAGHNGVDVKIVLDKKQSEEAMGSLDHYLADNGIAVRKNGKFANMHNKFMVIDDDMLEVGSFNYTRTAEEENAENVLVIRGAPDMVKDYARQWEILWGGGS